MNPPLGPWRKLDRYLIRNHAGLWLLQLHRLHAWALAAMAALALVVFLLPWENLLAVALWLKGFVAVVLLIFLLILPIELSSPEPFVRLGRWPHVLSVWYCLIITSAPCLALPWMIHARVFQQVVHDRDAERWSFTQESYPSDMAAWKAQCEKTVAEPDVSQEAAEQICTLLSPASLYPPFLLGNEPTAWLSFLLLLLLLAQRSMLIGSSASDSYLEGFAVLFGVFLTPFLGLFVSAFPPSAPRFWIISGGMAVLVLCLLTHVARAPRITPTFILNWSLVLAGVPLLAILGFSLVTPLEVQYQVLYLGLVLILVSWLQRLHDRLRALPS